MRLLSKLVPPRNDFQTSRAILFVVCQAYGLNPTGLGNEFIQRLAEARFLILIELGERVLSAIDIAKDLFTIQINSTTPQCIYGVKLNILFRSIF